MGDDTEEMEAIDFREEEYGSLITQRERDLSEAAERRKEIEHKTALMEVEVAELDYADARQKLDERKRRSWFQYWLGIG